MFYNIKGMVLFMTAYFGALFYTASGLAGFDVWGRGGIAVFALWLLFGLTLPLGIFQESYSQQLRRLGGVALTFVLHLAVAFLFLDVWTFTADFLSFSRPSRHAVLIVMNATFLWIAYGVARAQRIVIRSLKVSLFSSAAHPPVKIVVVADIHAGGTVERRYLERLRKRIGDCRPDVLLLVGDIVDGDIPCAEEAGIDDMLSAISAPLGKYAVLGNHDIYAGASASRLLLEKAGVTVLQDEALVIDNAFILAGRNDPRGRYFGLQRSPLVRILKNTAQPPLPIVVADHTPVKLNEADACGVALQFSGHTHGGQVFPFNLMMKWIYGISAGVICEGRTTVCVSSGAGLWTMPLRTVTDSEIVQCTLSFDPSAAEDTPPTASCVPDDRPRSVYEVK